MIVVGVTGKYCSGKSTVSDILAEHGYVQIDVDKLGHLALEREAERVIAAFGERVAVPEKADASSAGEPAGSARRVDRKALGRIVFSNPEALRRLEAIVHPTMVEMAGERVREIRGRSSPVEPPGVVINAAILVRMGLHTLCDTVIFVTAPFFATLRRARERDNASILTVLKRLRSQSDVDPQHSHPDADTHSVENDGDRDRLREQLAPVLPLP